MPTYPPHPHIAAQMGEKGNPECRCPNAMAAVFCMTGHMMECHYPLTCEQARCSHWERETGTVGRYPEEKDL